MKLPDDFRDFLKLLNDHRIRYLLIGGYAVGLHGYPRATGDLDIWVDSQPENSERLTAAVRKFGFDLPEVLPETFQKADTIFRMGRPPIRIEIHTSISGVEFEKCFKERILKTIDGININLINLENLLINKRAAGRHRDLDDIENLIS